MRNRYSVLLRGSVAGGATSELIELLFDLATVIPVSLYKKQFSVYSAFASSNQGNGLKSGILVSINFPQGYNKNYSGVAGDLPSPYVALGIANPYQNTLAGGATTLSYEYGETSCLVRTVEYPSNYPIIVSLKTIDNSNLSAGQFYLNLTFEECYSDE